MQCDYYSFLDTFPTEFCNENLTAVVKMSSFLWLNECWKKIIIMLILQSMGEDGEGVVPPQFLGLDFSTQQIKGINPNLTSKLGTLFPAFTMIWLFQKLEKLSLIKKYWKNVSTKCFTKFFNVYENFSLTSLKIANPIFLENCFAKFGKI